MARILVTGAAGFIGAHTALRLLRAGHRVVGVDALLAGDRWLERERLARLAEHEGFDFHRLDLSEPAPTLALLAERGFDRVVHLAAVPGVRDERTAAHVGSNLVAFANVLEGCRLGAVGHLLYASSSSVYGSHASAPSRAADAAGHPLSFYAATKLAGEAMAHSAAHAHGLPCTGLRFFTVYGPWGRPDMAVWTFTRQILAGEPVRLHGHGDMRRDLTYVDDAVAALVGLLDQVPEGDPAWDPLAPTADRSPAPWRIFNVGSGRPVALSALVDALEALLGKRARREGVEKGRGEVRDTHADIEPLRRAIGWRPEVPLEEGLRRFVAWYRARVGGC